jgi:ABC-2 type transport system permease protein
MGRRIREIVRKELIQTLRERRMRVILFVPPMLQLLMFGYAVNLDLDNARIAWFDQDRTPRSRELRDAFEHSPYFTIVHMPGDAREVRDVLDHGRASAVVSVLPGFGRDLERGDPAQVQVLVDGTNSNTASIISNYSNQLIAGYSSCVQAGIQKQRILAGGAESAVNSSLPQIRPESRAWFNAELKSRNYFVPGVVVNIIMLVTLMLTALALVREKEIGTMEQLLVTPVRPIEVMLGKTIPFAFIGLADMVLVTTLALAVFEVPFRGNALILLGSSMLFLLTTLGAGLFISTVSSTQQQAMLASFVFTMPAFMLSGFAFPIRNMPEIIQWITYLNPVRYFMEIVRGLFLKGSGIELLWPQVLALGVYGVLILGFSALRFRKRLD